MERDEGGRWRVARADLRGLSGTAKRFAFRDKVALVTGAAGGIGRSLAVALARRGCRLALADIDEPALAESAVLVATLGVAASRHVLDVADRRAVAALPAAVDATHGRLDILVNNAGVALGGRFEDIAPDDFDWLMEINFGGLVRMTRAFLPLLRRSPDARIVNMSSLFGLIAPPGQTAYVASKFAVRGFSEALRHELAGSPVGVTTVHPGGVATRIAANARSPRNADPDLVARETKTFEAMLKLSPDAAATSILDAVARRRARVVVGSDARVAAALERLLPVSYWPLLARLGGRAAART